MTSTQITLKAGEVLFREGDVSGRLYFVKDGQLMVYSNREALEIPLEILKEGDFIGTVSLFTSEKRSASVRALKDSTLDVYSDIDLQKLLSGVPLWIFGIMKDVTVRLKRMDQLIAKTRQNEKLLLRQFPNRIQYSGMICRLLKMVLESRAGGAVLQVNYSYLEFPEKAASILGISGEVITPIFQEIMKSRFLQLESDGLDRIQLSSLSIDYLDRLAAFFEKKNQMRSEGRSETGLDPDLAELELIRGVVGKGVAPTFLMTREVEAQLEEQLERGWMARLIQSGVLMKESSAGRMVLTVDLELLNQMIDMEQISDCIQKLALTMPEALYSL